MPTKNSFLRFSLRALLVCITLLCILLAYWTYRSNRQRLAVEAFTQLESQICYFYQAQPNPNSTTGRSFSLKAKPIAPKWLRNVMGDDYFVTPVRIWLPDGAKVNEEALVRLKDLPYLEELYFCDVPLDDAGISNLKHLSRMRNFGYDINGISSNKAPSDYQFVASMPDLQWLSFVQCNFADDDAAHLARLSKLEHLILHGNPVGDEAMASIGQLSKLEILGLAATKVTDRGIAELTNLQELASLCLIDTGVSDASIPYFARMRGLTHLELWNTKVTKNGLQQIREALPECKVDGLSLAESEAMK